MKEKNQMNEDKEFPNDEETEGPDEALVTDTEETAAESKDEIPDTPAKAKKPLKISLLSCVISIICVALAAVMITYTCCLNVWKRELANNVAQNLEEAKPSEFDIIFDEFFSKYSFEELDRDQMMENALRAYIYSTGDVYAEYYPAEEWKVLNEESQAKSKGIGINVIESSINLEGVELKAFKVISISKDAPAEEYLEVGDYVAFIGKGDEAVSVDELGYNDALNALRGEEGTFAEFTAYRKSSDGSYEKLELSIERKAITTTSVYYHVCDIDKTVGIVKIIQFDLKTPEQFSFAVDSLLEKGCTKFVFDVRYNPGGRLEAIETVLSYFLDPGDAIIHTSDRDGNYMTSVAEETKYITADEIGKYKGLNSVVLCNGSTASAAELFTATFRDYEMATIVGTKTYGKGSVQSLCSLWPYGFEGGLKLTTYMYFPPSGEGYDGIGIAPDVEVELDESLKGTSVFEIKDEDDNQLRTALEYFKK